MRTATATPLRRHLLTRTVPAVPRFAAVLALALLLAACGGSDVRAPFTDSRVPPGLDQRYWPPDGWTWGLIQVGRSPPQRYGVAAPAIVPRAQVLILPGYGEPAEAYFDAVSDFTARGCVVWVLEGVGQGGSGRVAAPRDLGYVRSFDDDVSAVQQLAAQVIRPQGGRGPAAAPLIVLASGSAAPAALRALQRGVPGIAGVVLTRPSLNASSFGARQPVVAHWAQSLGFGGFRAPGGGWRRNDPSASAGERARVSHAWQVANPDLRMGGPSLGWLAAFDELTRQVQAGDWRRITAPVLVLEPPGPHADAERLCKAMPRCRLGVEGPSAQSAFIEQVIGQARPVGAF
jgi:lysophospholipase